MVETRGGGQPSPKKLKFHEKLVGKGLSTDALLKKLKALHKELADMDQEVVDTQSLSGVRKELVNKSILLHKDRGVKAYAACCLSDLLRLYAPDAPYTQDELGDIFAFFFRQLQAGLKGAESPYYNEYFHLLESLSTVKSVVLVCDLPKTEELMETAFKTFFALMKHDLAKKVELFMADILIALIDECGNLPSDVLQVILEQFTERPGRTEHPAYRLATTVCNATADKLQQHVCQYLSNEITSNAKGEDYEKVEELHELIKELSRSCPSLLANVIPQLEAELGTEKQTIRLLATQVMGEIFADKNGAEFAKKHRSTWATWLQRKQDKAQPVRIAFIEGCKGVLTNLPELRDQVEDALETKILDPDEKVRGAVCKLLSQLDYETALHHVSPKLLRLVAGRGLDKKRSVRLEATNAVAKLYSIAYSEIESNDPAAYDQFHWIPQALLHNMSAATDTKAITEQAIAEYILPLPSLSSKPADIDEVAWTDRLLFTTSLLDDQAKNSLLSLSGIKSPHPTVFERYIDCCVQNNGGVIDENEEQVVRQLNDSVKRLAASFIDPVKAAEDLHSFANLNESRLYKLMKTCMDPQTDLKTLVKSSSEFIKRVEQSSSTIVPTMTSFLRRASLRTVNQSSIPTLIRRIQKASDGSFDIVARNAEVWLAYISKHLPALYKSHVGELTKAIADERNVKLVEVSLQALAATAQWDPKLTPIDKRTQERLVRYVMESNHRRAKFAARLLTLLKDSDRLCSDVVETIADSLSTDDEDLLAARTAVLAQIALRAPDAFELKSDVVTAFLLKKVIMSGNEASPDDMDTEVEWIETADLPPMLRAKILALKVCRNRCLAHSKDKEVLEIARPVLKMFATILEYSGSFNGEANDETVIKTRLRLQAAVSMLRMASVEGLANEIQNHFVQLALTIQDPCYQVRGAFLDKVISQCSSSRLHPKFNIVPFLTVHDPDSEIISKAKAYVVYAARTMPKPERLARFEMIFFRLLHFLAHHPDFGTTEEAAYDIGRYIEFYLDLIASPDNIPLLFHLAMKAKTVRDAYSHLYSENLYAVSEMAQHLIKLFAAKHSWSVESYPGKVRLPGDIVRPLPSPDAANEILRGSYVPLSVLATLDGKPKPKVEPKPPSKRKAAAPKTNGNSKRARTKGKSRKRDESDEEQESSIDEDEDDDDDGGPVASEEEQNAIEEDEEPAKEERLSRGARTRAKARIKQQSKKSTRSKPKSASSED
ncbi:armadillo-type protein [Cristinia sonorae]|uniref:Armadillo-type protein n=1 Tax=Cristinia sonorae TaxID=1940300 RepID=A0A8K0XR76_9AGAR|nr:armadillo-type protein [Cristinia sonorae]